MTTLIGADGKKYQVHPAAEAFELADDDRIDDMAASIKRVGQRDPIGLLGGAIIDGRNRFEACKRAGVKPEFTTVKLKPGVTACDYVAAKNAHRRDQTPGQRALAIKKLEKMKLSGNPDFIGGGPIGPPKKSSTNEAAKQHGIPRSTMQRAGKVVDDAVEEVQEAVANKVIPVSVAANVALASEDEQREAAAGGAPALKALAKEQAQKQAQPDTDPLKDIDKTGMVTAFVGIDKGVASLEKKLANAQIISTAGIVNDAVIAEYLRKSKKAVDLSMLRSKCERVQRVLKHILTVMQG